MLNINTLYSSTNFKIFTRGRHKPYLFTHPNPTIILLLVRLLVGQLLPFFYISWYDLPTNNPTNYSTNKCISWIWMHKKGV